MSGFPWSSLIGAAGNIAGGLLSQPSKTSVTDHYWDNYNAQKEFAQNGLRWRVADAKAAGLHPLAALGASGASFSPSGSVAVGTDGTDASWLGDVGQNLGRAIESKMTKKERLAAQAYETATRTEQLQALRLQNKLTSARISLVEQQARASALATSSHALPPPMPSAGDNPVVTGQAQAYPTGKTSEKPPEIASTLPGEIGQQAGYQPSVQYLAERNGQWLVPSRSDAAQSAYEDDWIGSWLWNVRNRVFPEYPGGEKAFDKDWQSGKIRVWNPFFQVWTLQNVPSWAKRLFN